MQPANKTLIANNGGGNPLDLSSAGDITLRPKMNFIYEQEISALDGVSPQYATSIGSEDTFGGS